MRSRRSRRTWTPCWPDPTIRMQQNDETISGDRYGSPDYLPRLGGGMAVSYCGRLRSDLACAGGNSPSHRQERIQTQLCDTSTFDFTLPDKSCCFRSADLPCRQIVGWRSSTISPESIDTEYLGAASAVGRWHVPAGTGSMAANTE